jgi:glycosyltransferase involved in cell wall biosynthesis
MDEAKGYDISVTVFCRNEAARIGACLAAIAAAGAGFRLAVTVIANGSTDDSIPRAIEAVRGHDVPARIYSIDHADKANAINHSFYELREPARLHVFTDAYAVMAPDSFNGFATMLARHSHALAATGVAGNGRTMMAATDATLREGGRLHGQLHAFRPDFLDRLTALGLRLPIGLYRGDGLLGSMACHDLDPIANPWDSLRIKGVVEAVYTIPRLSPLRPADIARQFRRKIRQMRGRLENEAIKSVIYANGFGALPAHADDMIRAWLAGGGHIETSRIDRAFMQLALRDIEKSPRAEAARLQPHLVHANA